MTRHPFDAAAEGVVTNPFVGCMLIDDVQILPFLGDDEAVSYDAEGDKDVVIAFKDDFRRIFPCI